MFRTVVASTARLASVSWVGEGDFNATELAGFPSPE
jgi:hypothetical protein